jgi:hypothetical protein
MIHGVFNKLSNSSLVYNEYVQDIDYLKPVWSRHTQQTSNPHIICNLTLYTYLLFFFTF